VAALAAIIAAALRAAPNVSLRPCACVGVLLALLAGASGEVMAATVSSSLVNQIRTSRWSLASPDPSGLAYDSRANRLLVVDGEVDEMSIFSDANYYEATLAGELVGTADMTVFTQEPVGIAFDPGGRIFLTDDDRDMVFELPRGASGSFDAIAPPRSFSTAAFGSDDPEGVSYDSRGDRLFIADGSASEIYEVSAVDGVFGNGNDLMRHFDTKVLGVGEPETVEFDPARGTLYVIGARANKIAEVTTSGARVAEVDTSYVPIGSLGSLAYAPSSRNATRQSFYIADRKLDNDGHPNENDGTIYEVTTRPSVALRRRHSLRPVLAKGIPAKARCSTACRVTARLRLRHVFARRPERSHSKPIVLAKGRARLSRAGSKSFRIEFRPGARRRFKRARKLELSLHATVSPARGEVIREMTVLVLRR
jgi:uncharacterized protein YjiK